MRKLTFRQREIWTCRLVFFVVVIARVAKDRIPMSFESMIMRWIQQRQTKIVNENAAVSLLLWRFNFEWARNSMRSKWTKEFKNEMKTFADLDVVITTSCAYDEINWQSDGINACVNDKLHDVRPIERRVLSLPSPENRVWLNWHIFFFISNSIHSIAIISTEFLSRNKRKRMKQNQKWVEMHFRERNRFLFLAFFSLWSIASAFIKITFGLRLISLFWCPCPRSKCRLLLLFRCRRWCHCSLFSLSHFLSFF